MIKPQVATIVRVAEGGVAFADIPDFAKLTAFTFGKIAGYRGETAKELGLRPGKTVLIEFDESDEISSVSLAAS